jgi:hypothetical protein
MGIPKEEEITIYLFETLASLSNFYVMGKSRMLITPLKKKI